MKRLSLKDYRPNIINRIIVRLENRAKAELVKIFNNAGGQKSFDALMLKGVNKTVQSDSNIAGL